MTVDILLDLAEISFDILDFSLDVHDCSRRGHSYMQKHKMWLLMKWWLSGQIAESSLTSDLEEIQQSLWLAQTQAKKNIKKKTKSSGTSHATIEELIEHFSICSSSTPSRWKSSRFSNKFVALNWTMYKDLLVPTHAPQIGVIKMINKDDSTILHSILAEIA